MEENVQIVLPGKGGMKDFGKPHRETSTRTHTCERLRDTHTHTEREARNVPAVYYSHHHTH
jgi:hypothetical protein